MVTSNNNRKIIAVLFCLLSLPSCMFDTLDEDISGIISSENFYQTEADLEAAVIAMYSDFGNSFRHPIGQIVMMAGDDLTTRPGANKQPFRDYDRFNYSADQGWLQLWAWNNYWNTIHEANSILANYERAEAPQEKKDRVAAQAYFMRGLSYYFLVRMFGGVPEITTPETTGQETRASILEIYQLIEADLENAESGLPLQWEQAAGKATLGAAKTVLASLYLTWAGWPLQEESKYTLATQKAQEVMDSGVYGLLENYGDLWVEANDNSIESVFTIQFDLAAGDNTWNNNQYPQANRPFEEQGWNDVMAEIDFFRRFPEGPRKEATFKTMITLAGEDTRIPWTESQFGHPYYQKWLTAGVNFLGGFLFMGKNIDVFRYAETLLIFAEAKNKAEGPVAAAYDAINSVRNRAGLPDLPPGLSQAEFHQAVIDERAWELAGEYSRWFDLVRNEMVEQIPQLRDAAELPLLNQPQQEVHAFAKIPQEDIDLNPNLKQNPEGNQMQ